MPHVLEVIDNHSVATGLLRGGPVLDAGARGFRFSKWFAERGHEVYAVDPSPDITCPEYVRHFDRVALLGLHEHYHHFVNLEMDSPDKEAWFVTPGGTVPAWNIHNWGWTETNPWDLVKLNIEGAEFGVLKTWPGPIARQIVASFHQHCPHAKRSEEEIASVVAHLEQWYETVRHVKDDRYCAGPNYWDSIWVLRGMV